MKALLVYPICPETFWGFHEALPFLGKKVKAAFPPLGLATIIPMFPENWKIKVVDMNVEPLADELIIWADVVFVSAMLIQLQSTNEIIRRCKDFKKIVVGGGPAFTTSPEKFPGVDHVLIGEAEDTLSKLLSDLESGNAEARYTRTKFPDIRQSPKPAWGFFDTEKYASWVIQTSRGCPFKCEFCDVRKIFGGKVRTKTPSQIISELQDIYDLGWRGPVFFVDDNFIGNLKAAKELLIALIKWQKEHGYPFKFFGQVSINIADHKELLQLMPEANFHQIFVGIETPNPQALRECKKFQNVAGDRDLVESVRIIQQNGLKVMGGFIVGFDSDTPKIFEATTEFIETTGIVAAMIGPLIVLPGTDLEERLKNEGRPIDEEYEIWDNTRDAINFDPKMGKETLLRGYNDLVKYLYSEGAYYRRIDTLLFGNYLPKAKGHFSIRDTQAFLRSIWKIGIFSKERRLYWKLLLKTAKAIISKQAPLSLFSEAVVQAIYGRHFISFAEKITR